MIVRARGVPMSLRAVAALGCALVLGCAGSALAEVHRYVVMAGGEKVGHLIADVQPRHVAVDYAVVNNGRGPKALSLIHI